MDDLDQTLIEMRARATTIDDLLTQRAEVDRQLEEHDKEGARIDAELDRLDEEISFLDEKITRVGAELLEEDK